MTLDQWRAKRKRRELYLLLVVYGLTGAGLLALALLLSPFLVGAA